MKAMMGLKTKNGRLPTSVNTEFGAGLGIISTINMLFVIGFVGISREQSPHEGPHIKSLCFFEGYHEKLVCN